MKILTPHPQHDKFLLHAVTENYFFFIDAEESDENAAVKMYDKENVLISDNYFACEYLWEILAGMTEEKITFISSEMEYNRQEIVKEILTNSETNH